MIELDKGQKTTATKTSKKMDELWRITFRPKDVSIEMVPVIEEGMATAKMLQEIGTLTKNLDDLELFDLVYLGLYHLGYVKSPEFKYSNPTLN